MCLTDSGDERAIRPDVEAIVEGKPLPSFDFREPGWRPTYPNEMVEEIDVNAPSVSSSSGR